MKKEIEKELENLGKKKKPFQPKPAQQAQSLARLPPLTGGPRLSAPVSRARPLSLARCPMGPICRRRFPSPARSLSLSLSRRPGSPVIEPLPRASLLSLSAPWASPVCSALSTRRRGRAHAHSRTSPGFSGTTPAHAPNPLLIALLVPRTHPSPHFAHPRPLSRSALAASRRRRPAPASPAIQLTRVRAKPPRAPP
jgi:hypothetical protein